MNKLLKITGLLVGAGMVFLLVLTLVLHLLFPPAKLRQLVLDEIHKQLNREAQLGDAHLGITGLTLERFRLSNMPSFSAGTLLSVEQMKIRWALWPLLSKQAEILEVALEKPQIDLIRMADGKTYNISDLAGASATSGKTPPSAKASESSSAKESSSHAGSAQGGWTWRVDEIHLNHGLIRFDDRSPARQTSALSDIDLRVRDFDPTRVQGHLTIAQLQNPVYIARDVSLDWQLHDIDPTLGHLTGQMRLKQGRGTVQNLISLTNSSKGAKLALMPLVMLQNIDKLGFVKLGLPDFSHLLIDHITGEYQFDAGTMKIQTFEIVSPQLSINTLGTVELASGNLSVDVALHTPQPTLMGEMDLKMHISGTLSNPKTNLDSLKKQAFKATVKQVLDNPDAVKNIDKTLKSLFH